VSIYMEQEPGASGKALIDHYARHVLVGFTFRPDKVTGNKGIRANPVSSAVEAGNVKLVRGTWITDYLDELEAFPLGSHDDQVDATSGAFSMLNTHAGGFVIKLHR
ncbi:MAG: phage terminase large subunit, partial [Candidatus Hermodarchaeia archaeon]